MEKVTKRDAEPDAGVAKNTAGAEVVATGGRGTEHVYEVVQLYASFTATQPTEQSVAGGGASGHEPAASAGVPITQEWEQFGPTLSYSPTGHTNAIAVHAVGVVGVVAAGAADAPDEHTRTIAALVAFPTFPHPVVVASPEDTMPCCV